jgi:hypothetical protein
MVGTNYTLAWSEGSPVTLGSDGVTVTARLTDESATSEFREVSPGTGSAADLVAPTMAAWNTGGEALTAVGNVDPMMGDAVEITTKIRGTAAGIPYQQILAGRAVHGYFLLIVPESGQAIVVDTYAEGPPPSTNPEDWLAVVLGVQNALFGLRMN